MSTAKQEREAEGWQAEKHFSQRVYHYIVGTFSLCGRLGLYVGEVEPHTGKKGREDCSECFKRAEKRIAKMKKAEAPKGDE